MKVIVGGREYVEPQSATEAVARNEWLHASWCQAIADKAQVPVSDECDGQCISMGQPEPSDWDTLSYQYGEVA